MNLVRRAPGDVVQGLVDHGLPLLYQYWLMLTLDQHHRRRLPHRRYGGAGFSPVARTVYMAVMFGYCPRHTLDHAHLSSPNARRAMEIALPRPTATLFLTTPS